jgi:hypothetical protein
MQIHPPHFWGMDSYTLFEHVVGIVGVNQCMQAHIELSGLGVLPETALKKTQLEKLKSSN